MRSEQESIEKEPLMKARMHEDCNARHESVRLTLHRELISSGHLTGLWILIGTGCTKLLSGEQNYTYATVYGDFIVRHSCSS